MEKTFNPHKIERACYEFWEQKGLFKNSGQGEPYCILLPPPNVTGNLHMGHAFQHTIMDALTRYHRMKGDNTLWQVGTDHAGIATQMVVERQLDAQGISKHDLGREKFLEKVWQWKEESGGNITQQMRRLGTSPDWSREVFTMDSNLSEAVQEVFIQLYDEGLIYRGKRLVNWDPVLLTAVSDLEVLNEEEDGFMWHMSYPLTDGSGEVVVATTRPETMLGDSAVAVHPDDDRYKDLIGKTVKLPITEREIPIIADDYVDPEFGTGCVKITPAHDFNDYEMGQRHNLPMFNIFTDEAKINTSCPLEYQELDRFVAREKVVENLKQLGLLVDVKPHKLKVPRCDRTGVIIEPYLTDQWYVAVDSLAKPAIQAVESGEIKFIPENWSKTYYQWMYNIQDWCISRQLWWGHRIPAWFDDANNVYVGKNEQIVREKYKLGNDVLLKQDNDVLDTWFSSALWPFATMGWPKNSPDLDTFLPSSVLVTGFDIIFFWVARMVMMTKKFTGKIPFKEIYITGLIRDENGDKMSKSKGNVLDPIDLIDGIDLESLVKKRTSGMMQPKIAAKIEKATRKQFADGIEPYGTDALRFTFVAMASTSRDINFDMSRVEGYRNFCNKIWNATRFVLMNTEEFDTGNKGGALELSLFDKWIWSRFQDTLKAFEEAINQYRFDVAAQNLYEFTWNQFCDWYLELSKAVLNSETATEEQKRGTRHTLINVLEHLMRLLHPIMPFITDEIYKKVKPFSSNCSNVESIMSDTFPIYDLGSKDRESENTIEWVKSFVIGIRNIRGEMDIAPSKRLTVILNNASVLDLSRLELTKDYLKLLAKLDDIAIASKGDELPPSATALVGEMEVLIPIAGLIDKEAELTRLSKAKEKILNDANRTQSKLNNENFVSKAPQAVISKEQEKLANFSMQLEKIQQQIESLKKL